MGDKSLIIFLISGGRWKPCPTHGMLVGLEHEWITIWLFNIAMENHHF